MSLADLLFFPPLMLAVAIVVGASGRRPGDLAGSIGRTFLGLSACIVGVALLVRLVVVLFA